MAFLLRSIVALLAFSVLASCQPANKVQVRKKGIRGAADSSGPATGQSNLRISFSDQAFQQYKVGTANLTYVFKYHGARFDGPIEFQGTQAALSFSNLPTNLSGDVFLEVYRSSALKMVGLQPNVELKNGANELTLSNFSVDGVEINSGWDGKTFQGNHVWKLEGQ